MATRSRFISVISQAAVVLAVAGATATVSASPLSPLHKKESISYEFTFVNGTTVAGTATSNTAYLAAAGGTDPAKPIGMNVHVSCSDPFTGGWGTKDGPSQTRDSAWQIARYTITKGSKTCGGQVGPVTPKIPKIDIEMFVNDLDADTPTGPSVAVPGTVKITYIVTNNGAKPLRSVSVVDNKVGAITCPKTALAVGESMTCTSRTASVTSAGQQSASAQVTGIADGDPASAPAPADKQVSYSFIFVNGTTVTGTATSNTAYLAAAGGTDPAKPIGMNVHVSCSDPFTGGWGKKDGPSQTRDSAWQIASYQIRKADKKGEKVCGQTFTPTTQTVTDSDPVHYLGTVAPPQPASFGDRVWHDLDRDGIQDTGEPGIAGASLTLLNGDGTRATDLAGKLIEPIVTPADGSYLFTNLRAGTYRLTITLDCTWKLTVANAGTDDTKDSDATNRTTTGGVCRGWIEPITIAAGTTNLTIDAGYYRDATTLGDFVWHDLDGDGIQDAGEPGIADAWVTLLNLDGTMPNDLAGNPLGSRYTKADGLYLFTNLKAGTYRLYVSLDCSWQATTAKNPASDDSSKDSDTTSFRPDNGRCLTRTEPITVTAGTTNLTIDAGYVKKTVEPQPAALGDFVWHDLDGDGIQDAGEPGIADAWVTLLNLDGTMPTDLAGKPLGSRYTKADGLYLFANLKAGSYRLYVSLDCAWQAATANAGADDAKDSDTTFFRPDNGRCLTRTEPITVTAGTTNLTIDAGYTRSF